jgi:hypothetical protein
MAGSAVTWARKKEEKKKQKEAKDHQLHTRSGKRRNVPSIEEDGLSSDCCYGCYRGQT